MLRIDIARFGDDNSGHYYKVTIPSNTEQLARISQNWVHDAANCQPPVQFDFDLEIILDDSDSEEFSNSFQNGSDVEILIDEDLKENNKQDEEDKKQSLKPWNFTQFTQIAAPRSPSSLCVFCNKPVYNESRLQEIHKKSDTRWSDDIRDFKK